MTVAEFKAMLSQAGIPDDLKIGYIDLDPSDGDNDVEIRVENYETGPELIVTNGFPDDDEDDHGVDLMDVIVTGDQTRLPMD